MSRNGYTEVFIAQEVAWEEVYLRYGGVNDSAFLDGSNANAFLHCYWSALISKKIGAEWATIFTNAHEYGVKNNFSWSDYAISNIKMDLYNNDVGVRIGTYNKNKGNSFIAEQVQRYVDNGWLLRIKVKGVTYSSTMVTNGDYR